MLPLPSPRGELAPVLHPTIRLKDVGRFRAVQLPSYIRRTDRRRPTPGCCRGADFRPSCRTDALYYPHNTRIGHRRDKIGALSRRKSTVARSDPSKIMIARFVNCCFTVRARRLRQGCFNRLHASLHRFPDFEEHPASASDSWRFSCTASRYAYG